MAFDMPDDVLFQLFDNLDAPALANLASSQRDLFERTRAYVPRRSFETVISRRHIDAWRSLAASGQLLLNSGTYIAPPVNMISCLYHVGCCSLAGSRIVSVLGGQGLVSIWERNQIPDAPNRSDLPRQPDFAFHVAPFVEKLHPSHSPTAPFVLQTLTKPCDSHHERYHLLADDVRFIAAAQILRDVHLYAWTDLPAQARCGPKADRVAVRPSRTFHAPTGATGVAAMALSEPDLVVVYREGLISVFDVYTGVRRMTEPAFAPVFGRPADAAVITTQAVLSAAGQLVVSSSDGHLLLYDLHGSSSSESSAASSSGGSGLHLLAALHIKALDPSSFMDIHPQGLVNDIATANLVTLLHWDRHVHRPDAVPVRAPGGVNTVGPNGDARLLVQPVDEHIYGLTANKRVFKVRLETLIKLGGTRPVGSACTQPAKVAAIKDVDANVGGFAQSQASFSAGGRMLFAAGSRTELPAQRQLYCWMAGKRRRMYSVAGSPSSVIEETAYVPLHASPQVRHGPTLVVPLSPWTLGRTGHGVLVGMSDGSMRHQLVPVLPPL